MRADAVVLVPVKHVPHAKGRLRLGTALPVSELVLAMAADVTSAAVAADLGPVVVMTRDPVVAELAGALGASALPEPFPGRLNRSLQILGERVRLGSAECAALVVPADCPAARPSDLGMLAEAARERTGPCFVSDPEGRGTTAIAAPYGVALKPRYGADSRSRHLTAGWQELSGARWQRLARDVDVWPHLAAAAALGVGERTAAWLAEVG